VNLGKLLRDFPVALTGRKRKENRPCGRTDRRTPAAEWLVGTWKLVSASSTGVGDVSTAPFRPKLTYTADGRMMAIIAHDGRTPLTGDHLSASR